MTDNPYFRRLRPLSEDSSTGNEFSFLNASLAFVAEGDEITVTAATARNPGEGQITHALALAAFIAGNMGLRLAITPGLREAEMVAPALGFITDAGGRLIREPRPMLAAVS